VHEGAMDFIITSAEMPYWRHRYAYRPEMKQALLEGHPSASDRYEKERRPWISAYAPVLSLDGVPVAILEVDISLDEVLAGARRKVIFLGIGSAVALAVILLGLALVLIRSGQSLRRFESELDGLDEPGPERRAVAGMPELGGLASAIDRARAGLRERFAELREERDRLRTRLEYSDLGITTAALVRRDEFHGIARHLNVALRLGQRAEVPVRLVDLTNGKAVVMADDVEDIDGVPGARGILRISAAGGQCEIPVTFSSRRTSVPTFANYLHVDDATALEQLPDPVAGIVLKRDAYRVQPSAAQPLLAWLAAYGEQESSAQIVDVSLSGARLQVDVAPEAAAGWRRWGDVRIAAPEGEISLPCEIRRLRIDDGIVSVGVAFRLEDGEEIPPALGNYIIDRQREMIEGEKDVPEVANAATGEAVSGEVVSPEAARETVSAEAATGEAVPGEAR